MKILCNIITKPIRELASQIGESASYTCNLVSVWQSENSTTETPTQQQLREFKTACENRQNEIYFAIPYYEAIDYNPTAVPIRHTDDGKVYLMKLPEVNPMDHFYKMYHHLPELKEFVATPEEAYRFILWREMAFMQYGLSKTGPNRATNVAIAEREAMNKVKSWAWRTRRVTPSQNTTTATQSQPSTNRGQWTTVGDKQIRITSIGYRKGDPQSHPDAAYIFTENAQADAATHGLDDSWIEEGYQKGSEVKLEVSDMNGGNQAGIRAVKVRGQVMVTPNAFGIVVKKYQQKKGEVRFLQEEGQFKDTDADFELFKAANLAMFQRLEASGLKKIVFPGQMGKGKAALPHRFAEWLQTELRNRFGVISKIEENTREGYKGYGLVLQSINGSPTQQTQQTQQPIQQTQQTVSPGPETKINIYAGTGENADLSNFAERPFNARDAIFIAESYIGQLLPPEYKDALERVGKFKTVEGAFQALKIFYSSYPYTSKKLGEKPVSKEGYDILNKLAEANGAEAKRIGRSIKGLDVSNWDKISSTYMKALIKGSFIHNPQALQRLLATGNATFTHTQDKGKWGTEFPRILMEVREELKREYPDLASQQQQSRPSTTTLLPVTAESLLNNAQVRVQQAKLLHKEEITDASVLTDGGIQIAFAVSKYPHINGVITFNNKTNKWRVSFYKKKEVSWNDVTPEENELTETPPNEEIQQKIVDRYIPKDLQEYYTSGQQREGDKQAINFYNILEAENPESTIEDRVAIWGTTPRGIGIGDNVLRDRWGIYSVNEYSDDINFLKSQGTSTTITESTGGYPQRTRENADWSDITLALAIDFNTAGEKLTKNSALNKYISSTLSGQLSIDNIVEDLLNQIEAQGLPRNNVKLNIAGNGIYTLSRKYTQEQVNDIVTQIIQKLQQAGITISEIRSGGQTGIDEAGIIAAQRLGIPSSVHAPKGFTFRQADGRDISNREAFERRFRPQSQQAQQSAESTSSDIWQRVQEIPEPSGRRRTSYTSPGQPERTYYVEGEHIYNEKGDEVFTNEREQRTHRNKIFANLAFDEGRAVVITYKGNKYVVDNHQNITSVRTGEIVYKNQGDGNRRDILQAAEQAFRKKLEAPAATQPQQQPQQQPQATTTQGGSSIDEEFPTDNKNVRRTLSIEEAKAAAQRDPSLLETPQPSSIPQQETEDVHKMPQIGTEVLNVDPDNPVAKLARDFTAMQRHDRATMLAKNFSLIVDQKVAEQVQENKEAIIAEMNKEHPNQAEIQRLYQRAQLLNDSVRGRRAAIEEIGLAEIFDRMRKEIEDYLEYSPEELDGDYGEGQGQYMLDAYQKILDNWEALLEDACILIEDAENLRVTVDKVEYNNGFTTEERLGGTVEESTDDADKQEAETDDDENGNRADGNGGWSYKVRFIDPRTSISRGVKRILANLIKEGIDGEAEIDDLGNIRYINSEFAHAVLINELSKMVDPDDFSVKNEDGTYSFPALEALAEKYPWVHQVIKALQAEPGLISSFYADFRKDFIPYWIQYFDEEDGKWKTKAVNQAVALDSTMTSITTTYEQGTILDTDSLYGAGRKINPAHADTGISIADDILTLLRDFDEDNWEEIANKTTKVLKMLGLNTTPNVIKSLLKTDKGVANLERVLQSTKNIFNGAKTLSEDAHLIDSFSSDYKVIAEEVGLVSELDNIQSFRIGDKTYYSYSAPNYLDTLFKILKDDERRPDYLERQFGRYDWFKERATGRWRSGWLALIEGDEDVRAQIALKELNRIGGVEYSKWEPSQIKAAFIREYFSVGINKGSKKQYAWYNFPIFSDSPVAKFIKFKRYVTYTEGGSTVTFKQQLLPLLGDVVKQELSRIKLVRERRAAGAVEIANFDKNGDKFHFFPELNKFVYEDGTTFLERAEALTAAKDINGLNELIADALDQIMTENFNSFLNTNNAEFTELRKTLKDDGVIQGDSAEQFTEALEEYFWNQAYATTQIIELTTTDLAFYKDDTDFQKRFKEVYAAGTKLNTNCRYGRTIERSIYLADQIVTSSRYRDVKTSLDKAVKLGHITSYDRDIILTKFKDINVADAQAYRSLKSMRAVLDMLGLWTPEMEEAISRFEKGEWNIEDFNLVWQTIKPFLYTQIEKPDGVGGVMKVPHQNKNSEFLLLAMYQMVANSMGGSPKLKALNRFMEDYDIDVIQFESAVKAGKQGCIDISYSESKLEGWKVNHPEEAEKLEEAAKKALKGKYEKASAFDRFKAGNDYLLDADEITQEEYNDRFDEIEPSEEEVYELLQRLSRDSEGRFRPEVVHEIPYTDYVIQQPTPEHLFDHKAVFGSQFRNLIESDLPDDFQITIHGKTFDKKGIRDLYHALVVENLLEDWEKVKGRFADIHSLQKALLEVVKGNPKYGRDIIDALQIVEIENPLTHEKEEVFNIPLDNPSTTTKIQEIVTSMFKNAVTKQDIKGGACILVSDFGLTKELNVLHGEDGRVTGIECYLPAYSRQFYEPFMITKKTADGVEYQELDIEKMPKELRKLVGYRIPTEDKYSMAPLIVKGFLPQQNGSAIMLPADITQIAGSDFDVDKMFLMIPEFKVHIYDMRRAREDFAKGNRAFMEVLSMFPHGGIMQEAMNELEDLEDDRLAEDTLDTDTEEFKQWWAANKEKYRYSTPKVVKVKYNMDKLPQEQKRAARNNMIIDIAYGILTHPDTAEKIHNPGSFDKVKVASRIATITSDPALLGAFSEEFNVHTIKEVIDKLLEMSAQGALDELDDFLKDRKPIRSQLTVDTFIYNHRQNMTGGALIGMYANNTTMQAKYQASRIAIRDEYTFTINGRRIKSLHDIFTTPSSRGGRERISKNCANFSAASVDNVKDPVLADLLQNTETANVAGFMLRAGMSIEEVGLLFTQPAIRQCILETGGLDGLKKYAVALTKQIKSAIVNSGNPNLGPPVSVDDLEKEIDTHDFTSDELLTNIIEDTALNAMRNAGGLVRADDATSVEDIIDPGALITLLESQRKAVVLMMRIKESADALGDLTNISRADSPNGAIKISIAGAKLQTRAIDLYRRKAKQKTFPLVGIEAMAENGIVNENMSKDELRTVLLKRSMPMLQAFYSLGIELGVNVMSNYFSQTSPEVNNLVTQLFDNSPFGIVSENVLSSFYSEFVEYALSKTSLFGNSDAGTFDEKRDYYLYDYPREFLKVLADNPDIAKMSIFKKIKVVDGKIIMERSGRITPMLRDTLMRDFDMLLYMDNPAAQKLAIDLFMYSYYKDGFKFGPNNFGTFFSSNFISAFPEVVNALRTIKYSGGFQEYLEQFYANHYLDGGLVPSINEDPIGDSVTVLSDGRLVIASKKVLNRNVLGDGKIESYPYIVYNTMEESTLYRLVSDGSDRVIYEPAVEITSQQKGIRGVKYNGNMSLIEMQGITTDPKRMARNKEVNTISSSSTRDADFLDGLRGARSTEAMEASFFSGQEAPRQTRQTSQARQTRQGSPNQASAKMAEEIEASLGGLGDWGDELDDFLSDAERDYSEDEGNAQLEHPMCDPKK